MTAADDDRYPVHPVTPDRWADLETLFGPRGAMGGCWCMWWRVKRSEFEQQQGEGNRLALKALVNGGTVPGLLAYDGDQPVGWVSVAPREAFGVLQRSRTLKPVDAQPVWSVVCFFIHKDYRSQGMSSHLLRRRRRLRPRAGRDDCRGLPGRATQPTRCPTCTPSPGWRRRLRGRASWRWRGGQRAARSCGTLLSRRLTAENAESAEETHEGK